MTILLATANTQPMVDTHDPILWAGFIGLVLVMLLLDLLVFHKKDHEDTTRAAIGWTAFWVLLALLFNAGIWIALGQQQAKEFFAGYLIEKALSVDNLFVFLVLFSFFKVPADLQHRVLFWGILGALVMRGAFIAAGTALLEAFEWVPFVFGGFLIITALKLILAKEEAADPGNSSVVRAFRKLVPVTEDYRGNHFIVREGGRRLATPLLMVLVMVEATDVVFAVDSIPAVFAVTRDPFIVFTSNVFAILGLRALYFVLASMMKSFHYLKPALSLVLGYVGVKMILHGLSHYFEMPSLKIPTDVSLIVIAVVFTVAIVASVAKTKRLKREGKPSDEVAKDEVVDS